MKLRYAAETETLLVTAESRAEAVDLNHHYGKWFDPAVDPEGFARYVLAPDERPLPGKYLPVSYDAPGLLDHYFTRLKQYATEEPDTLGRVDLTPVLAGLKHTHVVGDAVLVERTVGVGGYQQVHKSVREKHPDPDDLLRHLTDAHLDYLVEAVGHRPSEPEYVEAGNGMMTRNPRYLTRHKARREFGGYVSRTHEAVWAALFARWLEVFGSPAQRRLCSQLVPGAFETRRPAGPRLVDHTLYVDDPAGEFGTPIDYDGKGRKVSVVSAEGFRGLAGKE